VFVDTESMEFEAIENPAIGSPSGAGIQAAQFIVEQGAQAVVSGNVGPNAFDVLQAAGVAVYLFGGGTVGQAVQAFKAGQLPGAGAASAPAHSGIRPSRGGRMGRGMGMGRGMRRGMGLGMDRNTPPAAPTASSEKALSAQQELDELKEVASSLRAQLADLMDRLDRLEKGG
jgi:predicted Fe-Mo cluster-binding NifX family protein